MENSKKLVVYFSYTGHTKMIAERIKNEIKCDIIELERAVPYSNDYQEVVDDEQNGEASEIIPEIKNINIDLSKYDEIILGIPTWWYRPAPVVRSFLINNDLSGKVIKPFATNAGWLGRTFKELNKLCPKSVIEEGLNIVFPTDYNIQKPVTSEKEIEEWIKNL